jgi:hypothetical protein
MLQMSMRGGGVLSVPPLGREKNIYRGDGEGRMWDTTPRCLSRATRGFISQPWRVERVVAVAHLSS